MLYPFSRLLPPARSPASCGPAARKKRGFNLIEAAIVLGVVGLVIGGVWVAAAEVMDQMRQRQLVRGLDYYIRYVSENYPLSMASAIGNKDIDSILGASIPLPDGWKNVSGPIDPYGHALYIQIRADGRMYFGFPYQTLTGGACRAVMDYVFSSVLDKMAKLDYLGSISSNPACTLNASNLNTFSSNKVSYLHNCCPLTLGFYLWLPNR